MGLMFSREVGDATDGFYWSVHNDTDGVNTWSAPVPAVSGLQQGDDHINLKWLDSSGGRVFAAVKTSNTAGAEPLIELLAMASTGAWSVTPIAQVSECPNRVIVLIDEAAQRLRTFATYPKPSGTTNAGVCTSSGGAIYEKSSPLDTIAFTTEKTVRIVDADQYVHNVSSTKQNINNRLSGGGSTANSGALLLADVNATSRYWHFSDQSAAPPADTTAPTVASVQPTDGASGVASSANVTATFSEPMTASTVTSATLTLADSAGSAVPATVAYDSASNTATLNPTSDLRASATYTATITGGTAGVKDAAGNPLASNRGWSFQTAAGTGAGDGTGQTVTLTPSADSYVTSGAAWSNLGGSNVLWADASPVLVSYLKFDLSAYAGRTVTGATLQLHVGANGSTGRQNVKQVADDGWTETGITYTNKPALGSTLGALGPTSINTDVNVALTATGVQADLGQALSLAVDSTSTDGLELTSRETSTPPRLVLILAP
jgi:hypothetical protein